MLFNLIFKTFSTPSGVANPRLIAKVF